MACKMEMIFFSKRLELYTKTGMLLVGFLVYIFSISFLKYSQEYISKMVKQFLWFN